MKVLKTMAVLSMVFALAACKTAPGEEKKAEDTTPVDPSVAFLAVAFLDAVKSKLVDVTTAGGATIVFNADGKTIAFNADGTGDDAVSLTFVKATSATEATYTDGTAVDPKTATVTLAAAGGKFVYDGATSDFLFIVVETEFLPKVAGKTLTDQKIADSDTLIANSDGKTLTYTPNGESAVALTFVRATSATQATYESADNKVATVSIEGTVLTLVNDGGTPVLFDIS